MDFTLSSFLFVSLCLSAYSYPYPQYQYVQSGAQLIPPTGAVGQSFGNANYQYVQRPSVLDVQSQVYEPPRGNRQYNGYQSDFATTNSVLCRPRINSDDSIDYECDGVGSGQQPDITLSNKHVLWLSSPAGKERTIRVNVPNYKIQGLIQAAQKEEANGGKTNINVILQQPEVTYVAQQDDKIKQAEHQYSVNLDYQPLKGKTVHFSNEGGPGNTRYAPLNGRIEEPILRRG